MYSEVRSRLAEGSYEQYEISNYARSGRCARHNQAYWDGSAYLGLGAGAHSFSPAASEWGLRWSNLRDPNRYSEAIGRTGTAVAEREELTRTQAMGEACWLGLRQRRGLDTEHFRTRFGVDLPAAHPQIEELVAGGLLTWKGPRIALTDRGLELADTVFASFF